MCTDRRDFLRRSAGLAAIGLLGKVAFAETSAAETFQQREAPEAIRKLKKMTGDVVPITLDERRGRIEKARRLMREKRIDAIYLEPGSSMFYFTGMQWGTSERMFALVIPARGDIAWVCPKFEEERARELIKLGTDVRTWEEDESPFQRVAEIFRDRGLRAFRPQGRVDAPLDDPELRLPRVRDPDRGRDRRIFAQLQHPSTRPPRPPHRPLHRPPGVRPRRPRYTVCNRTSGV